MNKVYVGEGDIMNYGKAKSFVGEHITGRRYGIQVENTSAVDQVIALSPAILFGLDSKVIDGKVAGIDGYIDGEGDVITELDDGAEGTTGKVTVKTLNAENPVELMMQYAGINPFRIVHLALNATKKNQFSQRIEQRNISPFKLTDENITVDLRDHVDAAQFQDDRTDIKLINTNQVLTLGLDTVIFFNLVAGCKMEINMTIGALNNARMTMDTRGAIAHTNVSRLNGGRPVQ